MSENIDKNLEAMSKLLLLTQKGKIEWRSVDPKTVQGVGPEDIISSSFVCTYQDKLLRVYRRKYKAAPRPASFAALFGNDLKRPEMRWYNEPVLELISQEGHSVWQFPKETILNDLLEAIRYKASGADDLINSLLGENLSPNK